MSAESELDNLLEQADSAAIVSFFSGLKEKERKSYLARTQLWNEVNEAFQQERVLGSMRPFLDQLNKTQRETFEFIESVKKGKVDIPKRATLAEARPQILLAMVACAGLSELRKLAMPDIANSFAIMRQRNPSWLPRWLDLACQRSPGKSWPLVRQMEQEGLCRAERQGSYWLGMAMALGQLEADELIRCIKSEEELRIEMIWKMLESEEAVQLLSNPSGANRSSRNLRTVINEQDDWTNWTRRIEESRRASYIWRLVLAKLASESIIEQDKLDELIFSWLARLAADAESKASSALPGEITPAGWFQLLHDEIRFESGKKGSLVSRYISTLALKDSATLSWALQNLANYEPAELPLADLLDNISRVFYLKRKEPALNALKLLEKVQKSAEPFFQRRVNEALLEALEHSSSDIHKRVIAIAKKSKLCSEPEFAQSLQDRSEHLSGLIKQEINELLAKAQTQQEASSSQEDMASNIFLLNSKCAKRDAPADREESNAGSAEIALTNEPSKEKAELKARIALLPPLYFELAEIEALLPFLENAPVLPELPASLPFGSRQIPRLAGREKIEPLVNLDDLIFLYLHVLEGQASADDVERLLDGLMRLAHERPPDFESRVSSLRKKIKPSSDALAGGLGLKPYLGYSYLLDLQAVAVEWLDKPLKEEDTKGGFFSGIMKSLEQIAQTEIMPELKSVVSGLVKTPALVFFSERVRTVARHLKKRQALPLLAAPTHRGGFIDPLCLPARLKAWQEAKQKPEKVDFIQALLRLAPEHRLETLTELKADNDEYNRALSYALGGEMKGPLRTPEIWVAAFRCREPGGSSEALQNEFKELGPDSALKAEIVDQMHLFKIPQRSASHRTALRGTRCLPLISKPEFKERPSIRYFPTELLHQQDEFFEGNVLLEFYFPLCRESYFAYSARRMAMYLESQGNYWRNSWDSLFDPDVNLSAAAGWLLVLALSAKDHELSRLAVDAMLSGIEDGRFSGAEFGRKMSRAFLSDYITVSRWVNGLKELNRLDNLHRHFLKSTLEAFVAGLPADASSKPPLAMLELLYEVCLSSETGISDKRARSFLAEITGKGKGAKLAKVLLELGRERNLKFEENVALEMLEIRIRHAERWASARSRP